MVRGLCVAVVLLAPSLAGGQAQSVGGLVRQAVELRREGRDADALLVLERAWRIRPTAQVRAQIGFAEQALGRWEDAARHLREALEQPDLWVTERRAIVVEALAVVERHLTPTEAPRAATATTPARAPAERGPSSVSAGPAAPPATTPTTRGSSSHRTWAWVATGGVAVGVGLGTAMLLVRNAAARRWNDPSCLRDGFTRGEACGSERSAGRTAEALSVTGYAFGGASLVAAIALWATAPSARSRGDRAAVRCAPSLGSVGLACGGSF